LELFKARPVKSPAAATDLVSCATIAIGTDSYRKDSRRLRARS
jgi:hypothetical protein